MTMRITAGGVPYTNTLPGAPRGVNISSHRSVAQLARVRLDASGWPHANRSEAYQGQGQG
jgi:hypothetical protein